ncbi:MAG: winged helix-turn-helix domain-containing protein [Acidobacteriia bacterium]|nr:winged helix-turn-helix domain-containing protein [Terriglobia bacterium]
MPKQQYEFGAFCLDPAGPLLFREGQVIPLAPKVADVLLVLLENCGKVVEKEYLLRKVWPDTFVAEGSLARTVSILRKALGEEQEYIATVPKRGYRFVASVRQPPSAATIPTVVPGRVLLAVLPFQNLNSDKEQEYFADGMTEEMTTQLARLNLDQLRVIARTSAMTYKGTGKSIDEIGRELGVTYILEGSVRHWGDRVRISAQLVLAREQTHVWAQSYEENVADVLKLQSQIACAIADEIQIKLTPQDRRRLTRNRSVNPKAHELYLKGRYVWNRRTEDSLKKALDYFQQSLENDPTYAEGYVGLADSLNSLGYYNAMPPREAFPKAKGAAIRALQLDDSLGEAHAALGVIKRDFEWDWPGAAKEFKRALELNAGHADAHNWYATLFNMLGRPEDALKAKAAALELDPLSLSVNTDLGRTFYFARQYDRAVEQFQKTMEFDPNFGITYLWLGEVFEQQGLLDKAISHLEKGVGIAGGSPYALAKLGHGFAMVGSCDEARAVLNQLRELSSQRYVSPYDIAMIHVGLQENDEAFSWLQKAFEQRSLWLGYLNVEPQLDPLRSDRRFHELLRRIGLLNRASHGGQLIS